MAARELGRSALTTQTRPGANVLWWNSSECTNDRRPLQAPRYEPQFRREIEAIHRQRPVVLGYLVEALAAGADLRETVATYAALDGEFIATYGGDRFPAAVHVVGGASP
jgi:hypothetical protein